MKLNLKIICWPAIHNLYFIQEAGVMEVQKFDSNQNTTHYTENHTAYLVIKMR